MTEQLAKIDKESYPFFLMDKLDDELIKQELSGRLPDVLTYHFKQGGKEIWGLSKAGVDEAKAELAKRGEVLRVLDIQFIDGEEDGKFIVKAGRFAISKDGKEIMLDTAVGFKRQEKKINGKENPFWFEQGGVKAQRNAFHSLIPKTIVETVIACAKQQGKVKEVKESEIESNSKETINYMPPQKIKQASPPTPKPESKPDKVATTKQIWKEFKRVGLGNVIDAKKFLEDIQAPVSSADWSQEDIEKILAKLASIEDNFYTVILVEFDRIGLSEWSERKQFCEYYKIACNIANWKNNDIAILLQATKDLTDGYYSNWQYTDVDLGEEDLEEGGEYAEAEERE